jgi:hypothetical protein
LRSSSLILSRNDGMAGGLPLSTALRKRSKSSLGNLRRSKVTPPGFDHVAAVAGHAEVAVDIAPEIGVIGLRAGGQGSRNRERREQLRSRRTPRAWRASHAHTFFCRNAAT